MQNRSRFLEEVKEAKSILATLVSSIITSKGFIHQRLIFREVDWFFNQLGLEDSYFVVNEADIIADHIQCIYASKILAATSSGVQDYDLKSEHENSGQSKSQTKWFFSSETFLIQSSDVCGPFKSRKRRNFRDS